MFRIISIIAFIITLGGVVLHCVFAGPKRDDLFGRERRLRILDGLRILVFILTLLLLGQKLSLIEILRKLVYLLALLCFAVLAITGFFPTLASGEVISGYWLMLHATAGPVFAGCVAVLSVMWAHNCRFDRNDWPWLQKILQQEPANSNVSRKYQLAQKIAFWLIILLALPVMLSIVLSMFPLFGTDVQELLIQLHRYNALALAMVIIVHTYLIILIQAETGRKPDEL